MDCGVNCNTITEEYEGVRGTRQARNNDSEAPLHAYTHAGGQVMIQTDQPTSK